MPRGTWDATSKMQAKYVKARIAGKNKEEAKNLAGYSPSTKACLIEKPGNSVSNRIEAELHKRGLDDAFLAQSYAEGLSESRTARGREGDYNAYFKGLLQLGYLLGHGKKESPAVAVQINTGANQPLDPERSGELIDKLTALAGALEEKLGLPEPNGLHVRDTRDEDSQAHPGMGETSSDAQATGGGGLA